MKSKEDSTAPEALSDDQLTGVSGGYNEDEDPSFSTSSCPRGVNQTNFPCSGKCYSTHPTTKCMYLDEDDDGCAMIFSCSRYDLQKTE